jgi:hypothetical protein
MDQNDQVQEEPVIGNTDEIKKATTKEELDSSAQSSEKEEDKSPTAEPAAPDTGLSADIEQDSNTPVSESESDQKPGQESQSVDESESKIEAKSEPGPAPAPEPDPKSEVKPEAEPGLETQSEPDPEPKPEAKSEVKPEAEPELETQSEPEPEPKTEVKPEPEPKTEVKTEPVSDSEQVSESIVIGEFDYSTLSREDLVNRLEILIDNQSVSEIRDDVDHIKINFYKKVKLETEQKRKKFVEDGGAIEDFQSVPDELEVKIKDLFAKFRDLKSDFNKTQELNKQVNLKKKYEVIEKIKELITSKESINRTFHEFRDLQKTWRGIGLVPQQNLKDLWDTYNHHVEKFYDYIKINKELRDLDLKKNLELKIQLCGKAEELLLESSVIKAFQVLQGYHDQWREIGPVPQEQRTEIWERFREATSKINKKHQQHFEDLKKSQKQNLEQKVLLCEKAEELGNLVLKNHKQWDDKSSEIMEIQKIWKTIGFAPKKDNNKIYERFRTACDNFFNRKREFYAQSKEIMLNNLQIKTDLCVQAESLKDSKEWKKTTEDLINLQKKWKEVGPVPKKQSDAVWKRFRAACDNFFSSKSDHYKNLDKSYTDNLTDKKALLKEVEAFLMSDNEEKNLKALDDFQRRWSEIGYVPFKEKEILQEKFRQTINERFDQLDINENKRNLLKFKNKVNNLLQRPKADIKINQERERFVIRLQQLKSDIVLWENNIGFFAHSKNAESMIGEVQSKIDKAKEAIILLEEKIEMLDNLEY